MMEIRKIETDKKQYLDLLLLADPDEAMIDKYLQKGDMFALFDGDLKSICVVTEIDSQVCELKNLATRPACQHKGYGRRLVEYIGACYRGRYQKMIVGTGDSPLTIPFYEACGFKRTYIVPNFFIDNYPQPIVEAGIVLRDMVYLEKEL